MVSKNAVMCSDLIDDAVRTIRARSTGDLARVTEAARLTEQADHLLEEVISAAAAAGHGSQGIDAALWGGTRGAQQHQASRPASALTTAREDDGAAPDG